MLPAGTQSDAALAYNHVHKAFKLGKGRVQALDDVSLIVPRGSVTALVGPDGAGKTTLIRLAAGLMSADQGSVSVLGLDPATRALAIQSRLGYLPQRFGLYEDLTVRENLDLYADLQGVVPAQRAGRYPQLMQMTDLAAFADRLAGRLSGGMKQKLGLACALLRVPEVLLLDEPSVGVDPLSRRELWRIIFGQVKQEKMTVLLSTAYLDEAARCDHVIMLHEGSVLGQGRPDDFAELACGRVFEARVPGKPRDWQGRLMQTAGIVDATIDAGRVRVVTGKAGPPPALGRLGITFAAVPPRLEDGFMIRLHEQGPAADQRIQGERDALPQPPIEPADRVVVRVEKLVRRFGSFEAVRGIDFEVRRGEIFGLLGPNGAGKSTTFRMLCGLLPASAGRLEVAGVNLRTAAAKARRRVGYVAQKFSQYSQLNPMENLKFFASAYGLAGRQRRRRIDWAVSEFKLADMLKVTSGQLPGGYKQRLAMACALMHEPDILFLDEPTSGVDPLARRVFWQRINALAQIGVTIIVTTHFMEEAEYCDRLAIMVAGRLLALGTPGQIRRRAGEQASIEQAFIALVERQRRQEMAP